LFWDSLKEGADILTHWRFWAVTLSYGALGLVPMLLGAILMEKRPGSAFAVMMVSGIIWPVIILTGTILLLTPLMLGRINMIGWEFLAQFSIQQIAIVGGIGLVASILIAIIPIVGRMNSIGAFVQVAVMLGMVTSMLTGGQAAVWPGWLMGLGLAVTGAFIAYGLGMVFFMVIMAGFGEERQHLGMLAARPATALVSLVPACLYAGWLRVANGF